MVPNDEVVHKPGAHVVVDVEWSVRGERHANGAQQAVTGTRNSAICAGNRQPVCSCLVGGGLDGPFGLFGQIEGFGRAQCALNTVVFVPVRFTFMQNADGDRDRKER